MDPRNRSTAPERALLTTRASWELSIRLGDVVVHSKYSSGYGHHASSRGTLREYKFRRVRLEPREALTHAKERSAVHSKLSSGYGRHARSHIASCTVHTS